MATLAISVNSLNDSVRSGHDLAFSPEGPLSKSEIWGYGFLFVSIINLSSVMGIVFFPLMNKKIYATVMRVMIGLAIGSLSGSALFHLIPKALSHSDYHIPVNTLLYVWITIWAVMFLESSMKIALKGRAHKHMPDGSETSSAFVSVNHNNNPSHHSRSVLPITKGECESEPHIISNANSKSYQDGINRRSIHLSQGKLPVYRSTLSLNKIVLETINSEQCEPQKQQKEIKTVAWVIIFGDALHNFIDGVSIGAAFCASFQTGWIICLAIICEEFPHELGDFAILINSGLSVKKALLFNFASALTCYMGLVLGIILGDLPFSNNIFAVAAGIFLYVALGDMVPEITEIIEDVSEVSKRGAWKILCIHHIGIFVGTTILYVLAVYLPEG